MQVTLWLLSAGSFAGSCWLSGESDRGQQGELWGQQAWAQILTPLTNFTSLSLSFVYKMGSILLTSKLWLVQLKVLTCIKGLGIEQFFSSHLSWESLLN